MKSQKVKNFKMALTIPYIFETVNDDGSYPDEPVSGLCDDPEGTCYLTHIYTKDLPETYNLVYDWRELLDNYTKTHGGSPVSLFLSLDVENFLTGFRKFV